MAAPKIKYAIGNSSSTTTSSSVSDSATSVPLTSDTNFEAKSGEGMIMIDESQATEELAYSTGKSGASLTVPLANRGLEGGSAQAHSSGATVKGIMTAGMWNDLVDSVLNVLDQTAGTIKSDLSLTTPKVITAIKDTNGNEAIKITATGSAVNEVTVANAATGNAPEISATGDNTNISLKLKPKGTGTVQFYDSTDGVYKDVGAGVFWTVVPGTPTRVSDTQFTITDTGNSGSYDLLFKKGVILKWLESTTVNTAMVISSSYATNTVTIDIVGDSLTAGFTAMKYCAQMAQTLEFIVPGTLGTGTDVARTHYATSDLIKLSVDAYVKTAGTTNSTDFDINDDGSTIITTKPAIASTATSDIDNACDAPTTVIAANSAITLDIDAVSTTAPIEAYVKLFVYPKSWLYRS